MVHRIPSRLFPHCGSRPRQPTPIILPKIEVIGFSQSAVKVHHFRKFIPLHRAVGKNLIAAGRNVRTPLLVARQAVFAVVGRNSSRRDPGSAAKFNDHIRRQHPTRLGIATFNRAGRSSRFGASRIAGPSRNSAIILITEGPSTGSQVLGGQGRPIGTTPDGWRCHRTIGVDTICIQT